MENITIAVVDDHSLFREGVISTLNLLNMKLTIFEASDGQEFLDLISKENIQVVLMDINMPNIDGVEASKIALEQNPNIKIIALTMQMEHEYFEKMLSIGVKGFLTKSIDKDDLEKAIEFVVGGKQYFSEEILPLFMNKLSHKNNLAKNIKLSARELEVLGLIADGLTNQEIGEKLFISSRTVSNHRANLLSKTDTKNTAALIAFSVRNRLVTYK